MSRIEIGVIAGVLVVGLATFLFLREGRIPATRAAADMESQVARNDATSMAPTGKVENQGVEVRNVVPSASKADAASSSDPVRGPIPENTRQALPTSQKTAFDVAISNNLALGVKHAAMESERRDPLWASAMEDTYIQALAANSELRRYGMATAECKSTQCEIRLLANGAPHMERQQWGELLGRGLMTNAPKKSTDVPSLGTPQDFAFGSNEANGVTAIVFNVSFAR